jgi:molybdopterin-synthase adenylyltransferase
MELRTLDIPLTDSAFPAPKSRADVHFERQVRAFGQEGQARLARSRIAIVGLGGLGSIIAHGLCRLGVRNLVLVDPDRAEESNLNRLAGLTSANARRRSRKVTIIANRLKTILPHIQVKSVPSDIFEPNAWRQLRDVDVIIVATDNYATRMLLNQVSVQFLIPLVSCGVQIRTNGNLFEDAYAEVFVFVPGQPGPCLVCSEIVNVLEAYYEVGPLENRKEAARRGYIEGFDEPAPAVFHLNGVAANLALAEVHNLLCGFMPPRAHLHYKMSQRELKPLLHRADKRCAICAPNGGRFARGDAVDPVPSLFPEPSVS